MTKGPTSGNCAVDRRSPPRLTGDVASAAATMARWLSFMWRSSDELPDDDMGKPVTALTIKELEPTV